MSRAPQSLSVGEDGDEVRGTDRAGRMGWCAAALFALVVLGACAVLALAAHSAAATATATARHRSASLSAHLEQSTTHATQQLQHQLVGQGRSRDGGGTSSSGTVPGGPSPSNGPQGSPTDQQNGVTPQDCVVEWSVTVPCTAPCRGGFKVSVCTATTGPFDGGAPCTAELGDYLTSSCDGGEGGVPCACTAADFTVTASDGTTFNPFFDDATVLPCGGCLANGNGQPCYLSCNPLTADGTLSGDASISCVAGTWSLPQVAASCRASAATCPVVPESQALSYLAGGVCDGAEIGDVCRVYCNPGYILARGAAAQATCLEGAQWSEAIACVQVQQAGVTCPEIFADASLAYATAPSTDSQFVCVGASASNVCSVTCNAGYELAAGARGAATCTLGGAWSALVQCVAV